jgi:histidinol-phosphatase
VVGFEFGSEWSAGFRRGADAELRAWLAFALECCDAADHLALSDFRRGPQPERKVDRTFVTRADRAIERLIRERIADAFPAHGIVGEEEGEESAGASVRWYIDPIDGTHNYIRGIPLFGTLLAVERDGELQVGIISAPALRQRWLASRAGGAWNNQGPLRVSDVATVRDAGLVYTSAREILVSDSVPGFDATLRHAGYENAIGDFWGFGFVAEARVDAMIEGRVHPWDLAAPMILIEEAGGRMTAMNGERSVDIRGACVASNGFIHAELLDRLLQAES